ncbi:DNA ligase D [Sphingobacterium spiritivorum]|uniref:DNA ligase (ATP) n=1 Tax=Sphingobacterium spiritivorum ATCC 33861 TaxID=525373 RepID=D7VIG7_SPHSI|nr:DNA ligase D [Sphingobacterium spiritivorum]EFK59869.1 DNA ligase D [Sphingobacterium spiritivorum ATCC 33861]QQT37492.1 DNA ligase D [Sphingobacterium spiritivorum]WQD34287.1 DNA ligase D [Sphingobacterium spiritivorum]SUI97112.1 Putative DNA ligase-like protein Rv0938/MT0965 [Sphingobacterium spiritivorum]
MDKLAQYHKKRNFKETVEPKGSANSEKPEKLRFVVQRHHASRLHYDFRLEMGGVLKSWAVPKGPSLFPQDKRLAVQVEDHPVDYASFEGEIPKGNYGAGTVSIFDEGYFHPLGDGNEESLLDDVEQGSVKVILHGKILKGEFALVRIKDSDGKSWLLIKHKDKFAVDRPYNAEDYVSKKIKDQGEQYKKKSAKTLKEKSKLSASPAKNAEVELLEPLPMLTRLATDLPDEEGWLYEKKYDGFRIIAVKTAKKVVLYSRNGKQMNKLFPSVVKALSALDRDVWLDGEVVIEDKNGKAQFQLLQSGEPLPPSFVIRYYIFDILSLDENDLSQYPLKERKDLLQLLLKGVKKSVIMPVEALTGTVSKIRKQAEKQGWEGVIAKDTESLYHAGKRSSQWLKVKFRKTQEAVICGYTKPQGSRSFFGALVLGYYEKDHWIYLGNCGTGFTEDILKDIFDILKDTKKTDKPFDAHVVVAKEKEVTWVKPAVVCEVYYSEWTADRHLRHPVFKGLRMDKNVKDVQIERDEQELVKDKVVTVDRHQVKLTNLDKIYWPSDGYTKGQLLTYYEKYGDLALPYLKDKPISMHRFPNGIEEKSFFQKDVDVKQIPGWLRTVPMYSESTDKDIDYLICNNKATLLYIANLGSIEINPWLSTYKKKEYPDFAVLDLDPNGADFEVLIDVARTAHRLFKQAGVTDYIKTSGSTGLHIYLYVNKKYTYDVVRDFIQFIAEMIHEEHPDTTSLIRDPRKRKGLIYLDYLQNRRGQTIAAPYSVRPKESATISTPLHWKEVKGGLDIRQFNITSIADRLEKTEDPWADIFDHPADIKKALEKF